MSAGSGIFPRNCFSELLLFFFFSFFPFFQGFFPRDAVFGHPVIAFRGFDVCFLSDTVVLV